MTRTVPESDLPHNGERDRNQRRAFATGEISNEEASAIAQTRVDPRHDHLDALLDKE
jgi:hypothetical protein